MTQTTLVPSAPVPALAFEGKQLRTHTDEAGEIWFVAKDLCAILGITNSRKALTALDDTERGVTSSYSPQGGSPTSTVNEAGMWTLVLRCRDAVTPGTVPFRVRKWVTGEVLPSIRKTGGYGQPAIDATDAPALAAARRIALDYFDAFRASVKAGKSGPRMGEIPPEVLHGLVAEALMSQRLLAYFDRETGRMHAQLVPGDASVVSFASGNYFDIAQHIPMKRLTEMSDEINKRVACHLGAFSKHLQSQNTALSTSNTLIAAASRK